MTLVLLVAAGLLLQTFYQMRYADLGMRPEHVLTLRTALPIWSGYEDPARRRAFYDRVLDRVERLPGVVAAGYTTSVPLEWKGGTSEVFLDGRTPEPGAARDPNHRQVSAGYLKAIGTPLRRGRYFDRRDDVDTQPVVIVNETMARQSWPGEDAVGKRFIIDRWQDDQRWLTVVGVVGDTRQMGLEAPARPEIYIPYQQIDSQPWFAPRDLVVRASGDPTDLIGAIKAAIHDVDPRVAGVERSHARRGPGRGRGDTPGRHDTTPGFRRLCAVAGDRRDLRCHRLLRRAARTRDGRAHRAWRRDA